MGFLWHSPSEGPLSHPFTNYTHNTSYRPNARGGPSSYFSQSPELCVATSKYLSTPVIDYRAQRYLSLSWSAFIYYTEARLRGRKFLGLRYLTTQILGRTRSSWSASKYTM